MRVSYALTYRYAFEHRELEVMYYSYRYHGWICVSTKHRCTHGPWISTASCMPVLDVTYEDFYWSCKCVEKHSYSKLWFSQHQCLVALIIILSFQQLILAGTRLFACMVVSESQDKKNIIAKFLIVHLVFSYHLSLTRTLQYWWAIQHSTQSGVEFTKVSNHVNI